MLLFTYGEPALFAASQTHLTFRGLDCENTEFDPLLHTRADPEGPLTEARAPICLFAEPA